jgi:hypothetical protein
LWAIFVGKESHAKTQSREEDRKEVEGCFTLRAFLGGFAPLRETAFFFIPSKTEPSRSRF